MIYDYMILIIAVLITIIPIAYVMGFKKAVNIIYKQHGIKRGGE